MPESVRACTARVSGPPPLIAKPASGASDGVVNLNPGQRQTAETAWRPRLGLDEARRDFHRDVDGLAVQ